MLRIIEKGYRMDLSKPVKVLEAQYEDLETLASFPILEGIGIIAMEKVTGQNVCGLHDAVDMKDFELPKDLAQAQGFVEGDQISVTIRNGEITLKKMA